MEKYKVVLMGYVIQSYLIKNTLNDAKPKDLMEELTNKGFFSKDNKAGLPLRAVLRELDKKDELYLLPQVKVQRKDTNRFWYFNSI